MEGNTYSRLDTRELIEHGKAAIETQMILNHRTAIELLTFLDVQEQAYSRATLGVYEMTRVELLRDLYVWAYERSAQEYLAIKQELAEPDPLRLAWRDFIKQTLREVITQPDKDPLTCIQRSVAKHIPAAEQHAVQALLIEELRRLHEGMLARYGLRPSEYARWKALHAT